MMPAMILLEHHSFLLSVLTKQNGRRSLRLVNAKVSFLPKTSLMHCATLNCLPKSSTQFAHQLKRLASELINHLNLMIPASCVVLR